MAIHLPSVILDKGYRSLVLALRSLWLHKLRALLSVLGIVIGTGAVITLMSFGEGSMQDALEDIKRMGATNIIVRSVKPPDDGSSQRRSFIAYYGLTYADYERFGTINTVTRMVPMRVFPQEARRAHLMDNVRLVATTPDYADINKLDMAAGRFLTDDDELLMRNMCVLSAGTASKLFPFDNPLGQEVQIGTFFYVVVGVTQERMPTGGSGGSQAAEEYNNDIYISLKTAESWIGTKIMVRSSGSRSGEEVQISQVTITLSDVDRVRPVGAAIVRMLRESHDKLDYAVTIPLDRLEEAERQKARFTTLLAIIASISLLVGGIGIMNIMLATVTERTREIGIRRALGGKRMDIVSQFLIEAVVQTTLGGLIGVALGLAIVYLVPVTPGAVAWVTNGFGFTETAAWIASARLPAQLNVMSIFLAVGVSIIVGVVFGLYPAWRASRLDPIEALRHTS